MKRYVAGVLAVVGLSACVAPPTLKVAFSYDEVRGRLPSNGLRYVVMPDPSTQLVEVDIRYEVGSREDPPGKAGLAHLVEHLLLERRRSDTNGRPLMQQLHQIAVQHNAYTTDDATHFMLNARADRVGMLITLQAKTMNVACNTISDEDFVREREVVRNELRQRRRSPEAMIAQLTVSAIYAPEHPYGHPVGGDGDEQLSTITRRDACEFIARYYVPERAIMLVAGGISVDATIQMIASQFQRVGRRPSMPRREVEPRTRASEQHSYELDIERPWVTVAWPLPDARTTEGGAVMLGIRAAFFDDFWRDADFTCARRVVPLILGGEKMPVFALGLELEDADHVDDCVSRVWTVVRSLGQRFRSGRYGAIATLTNRRKVEFVSGLEALFGANGRTDRIADLVQFSRDVDFDSRELYAVHEFDRIGKIRGEDLQLDVTRTIDPDRARVSVFTASQQARRDRRPHAALDFGALHAGDPGEAIAIDPEQQSSLELPGELTMASNATRFSLDNGMRVVLLPRAAMPVVALELIFDGGESAAPDNPLVARAAAALLTAPDATMSYTGVDIWRRTLDDHTMFTVRGLTVYFDVMVKGLERLTRAGTYSPEAVTHWTRRLEPGFTSGHSRSAREFWHQQQAALYGIDHPYARSAAFVRRWLFDVTTDRLGAFQRDNFRAANATLIVAGAFDPGLAESLIRGSFGRWSGGTTRRLVPRPAAVRTQPLHIGVVGGDDAMVDIAVVYPSPAGLAGEQAARMVLTQMLADQMWSIRTQLGATYDPRAVRDAGVSASGYRLSCSVDAPRAGEVLREIQNKVDALRRGTELDVRFMQARRKVVDRLLAGSTVSAVLAAQLGDITRFQLAPTHYTDLLRRAATLSVADVEALLEHELAPHTEAVIAHGAQAAVTAAFADAGLDDVTLVDAGDGRR